VKSGPFTYCALQIEADSAGTGFVARHEIEANGPTDRPYSLFVHFFCPELDNSLRLTSRLAQTPDSREWRCGQRLTISHRVLLNCGTYEVYVGLFFHPVHPRPGERLQIAGTPDGRLKVADLTITDPNHGLGRTAPYAPIGVEQLLPAILELPAYTTGPGPLDHLALCFGQAPQFGHVLEFGVGSGTTICCLASLAPHRTIWGFDSFEGLPATWVRSSSSVEPAGAFSMGGLPPGVPGNVQLVKGWFSETVPDWLAKHQGNISFLHMDVDLYSSTDYVLGALNDRIVPGTVIAWDDLGMWDDLKNGHTGGYDRWRHEEWLGMTEWLTRFNREVAPFSRGPRHILGTRVMR
jgi:hypothetical protein